MSFKNYLKSKIKLVAGIAALAGVLSQLVLPAAVIKAAEPRFNFLPGDLEMIRGANVTQNETVWKNPVTGEAGDEFRGIFYYHNGVLDTVATNTRIKVNIPSQTTNRSAKITGSISADNAQTVTSTVVDGQIVGHDGLIVNLDEDADIEFVPGSVKWFPEGSQTPVPFPFGQSGNEIVSANGVSIDGLQGCWQFAGYLTFGFKTKDRIAPSDISLSKTVKNVTAGDTSFREETTAQANDELLYNIDVISSSEEGLSNVMLKDQLPSNVSFVSGSFVKYPSGGGSVNLSDADANLFFGNGLNIGSLPVGQSVKTTFQFKAKLKSDTTSCFINTAIVTAGALTASDAARVCVVAPNIVKSKSAYNVTKNEPANLANLGDVIEYTLTTRNTGTASVEGFVIEDDLSRVLNYSDIVSISENGQIVTSGNSKIVRYSAVTINPGTSVVRKFTVKVKSELPLSSSDYRLINVYGNEVVVIIKIPPKPPVLTIAKYVRDVTRDEANFQKANQAFAGDVLEYRINYSNTGTVPADQVRFYDVLPGNTSYISGTTVISRNGAPEQTLPDGIIAGGVRLDTIAVGESGYIKFRVNTSSGLASGQTLVNTAYLEYSGKTISDTAQTTIISKDVTPVKAGPTTLPKTGATGGASFLITFFIGIAMLYLKYRKEYSPEESLIINKLLS